MKVSSAIAEILKREEIDVIFGYPRKAVLEDIWPAIGRRIAATQAGVAALIEFMTARETRASRL